MHQQDNQASGDDLAHNNFGMILHGQEENSHTICKDCTSNSSQREYEVLSSQPLGTIAVPNNISWRPDTSKSVGVLALIEGQNKGSKVCTDGHRGLWTEELMDPQNRINELVQQGLISGQEQLPLTYPLPKPTTIDGPRCLVNLQYEAWQSDEHHMELRETSRSNNASTMPHLTNDGT